MKYLSLLFFPFVLCSFSEISPTNIASTIRFGDSLFCNKNYTSALIEYQRAYFFSESQVKSQAGARMAECYLAMNNFASARACYDSAIFHSGSDLAKIDYEFGEISCYILEGNFGYALLRTNALEPGEDNHLNLRKHLYQGICHYGMKQYDVAYAHFLDYLPEQDTAAINELQNLFENRNSLCRPNPGLAMVLSIILPGAGQIYSGDIKDGVNSIALLTGLTYLGISGSARVFVTLLPFVYRYYIGGILNARQAAEYKQQENTYSFYLKLRTILQK